MFTCYRYINNERQLTGAFSIIVFNVFGVLEICVLV